MHLSEFLLARIEEDEKRANYYGLALGTDRVLAECAAKRAIVAELTGGPVHTNPAGVMTRILRALAAVYADHPDYPDHKGE